MPRWISFTCNPNLLVQDAYHQIEAEFHAQRSSIIEIKRGLL